MPGTTGAPAATPNVSMAAIRCAVSGRRGARSAAISWAAVIADSAFVIDSAIVGVSKPDPAIFLMALDAASLPSSEVVYVGDYYAVDVVGARSVGITPVLFDPYGVYEDADCAVMNKFDDILGLVEDWTDRG